MSNIHNFNIIEWSTAKIIEWKYKEEKNSRNSKENIKETYDNLLQRLDIDFIKLTLTDEKGYILVRHYIMNNDPKEYH